MSLLVSILLPSLQKAKELANVVCCMNNLRALGLAYAGYTNEEDEWFPSWTTRDEYPNKRVWKMGLAPYLDIGEVQNQTAKYEDIWNGRRYLVFICPSEKGIKTIFGTDLTTHQFQNAFWDFPSPQRETFLLTDPVAAEANNPYLGQWPYCCANVPWFKNPSDAVLNMCWYGRMDYGGTIVEYPNTHVIGRPLLYVDGHVISLSMDKDNPLTGFPMPEIIHAY